MTARSLLLIAAATAATLALPASSAQAGTYEVLSCGAAGGVNNAWTPEISHPDSIAATQTCSGGSEVDGDYYISFAGSMALFTRLGAPNPPVGAYGYWRFDVPDPLRITALRRVWHVHSESDSWRLLTETDYGELSHCQSNEPGSGVTDHCDGGGGSYGQGFTTGPDPLPSPARWLRDGFRCTIAPCDTGFTVHAAGEAHFSKGVTVSDPVGPAASVSGVPGSAALGAGFGVMVGGADQTGIRRLELVVDGGVVAASDRGCDFTRVLPCEAPGGQVAAQLAVPGLSAGVHQIQGRAIDAAGNVSTSAPQNVSVLAPQTQPGPVTPTTPEQPTGPQDGPQGPSSPPEPTPPVGETGKPSAELKLRSVRRKGSRVRVRGQIASGCRGRVRVKVTVAGRTRIVRVTVGRSGKWGVWAKGLRRHGRITVRAKSYRSSSCTSSTAKKTRRR